MKLRTFIVGIVSLVFLILMVTSFEISRRIVINSFDLLDERFVDENIDRADNALKAHVDSLYNFVWDWAAWDDTYQFIVDSNQHYIESNLIDSTYQDQDLDVIIFVNTQGEIVWGKSYDHEKQGFIDIPDGISGLLSPGSVLMDSDTLNEGIKGVLYLPETDILLAAVPIVRGNGEGPPRGMLIMGRYLDEKVLSRLSEYVRLDLKFWRIGTPEFQYWFNRIQNSGESEVAEYEYIADDTILAGRIIPGIYGDYAGVLAFEYNRAIHEFGKSSLGWMEGAVILEAILICLTLFFLLEFRVVARLGSLTRQVDSIGRRADSESMVTLKGDDELGHLADQINAMLHALRDNKNAITNIFNSVQAGVIIVDREFQTIVEVNPFVEKLFNRSRDELIGKDCHGLICSHCMCPVLEKGEICDPVVSEIILDDGKMISLLKTVVRIMWKNRECLLETFIDMTELRNIQKALQASENKYEAIFMNTGAASFIINSEREVLLANSELSKLMGRSTDEIEGRKWEELFHPDELPKMLEYNKKRFTDNNKVPDKYETRIVNLNGEVRNVLLNVGLIPETNLCIVSLFDISELKNAQEQLSYQAFYDQITGLANRTLVMDRIQRALKKSDRDGSLVGVYMMDLDDFKQVNDSLGHSSGDEVLRLVAARLRSILRDKDTIARIGGDEFVIVVDDATDVEGLAKVAYLINDEFTRPFFFNDREIYLGFSIGLSVYPNDNANDPGSLLKNADLSMYKAKDGGRNSFSLFSDELNVLAMKRLNLEARLHRAVSTREFVVHYQPQIDLCNKQVAGVEALVRWLREDGTMVPPDEFVPLAEKTGLVVPMDMIVMEMACRQAVEWHEAGLPWIHTGVNLSARHFAIEKFPDLVSDVLERTGLPTKYLTVEITETLLMKNLDEAIIILKELARRGVRISLDDFGTGYSSLQYLRQLPIHTLKIDRSFVMDIEDGKEEGAKIVRTILSLAANLELNVVAEGVETLEQQEFLEKHGCTHVQGYFYSKPLPADELISFLNEHITVKSSK